MAATARHVRVTGQVQGVFFRQSAVEKARRLGVTGWVRNCSDGSVEAHVEGESASVEAMLEWLQRGPSHSRVDRVEVSDVSSANTDRFEIRH